MGITYVDIPVVCVQCVVLQPGSLGMTEIAVLCCAVVLVLVTILVAVISWNRHRLTLPRHWGVSGHQALLLWKIIHTRSMEVNSKVLVCHGLELWY